MEGCVGEADEPSALRFVYLDARATEEEEEEEAKVAPACIDGWEDPAPAALLLLAA